MNFTFAILISLCLGVLFFLIVPTAESFDSPKTEENTETVATTREQYLEDMVKYLTIVVSMHSAQKELYKLSSGFAQTFSSPRLDALEKQRLFFIDKIKKNPEELAFFRTNLSVSL